MPEGDTGLNFKMAELLDKFDDLATVIGTLAGQIDTINTTLGDYAANALLALDTIAGATQDTAAALGTAAGGPETTVAGLLTIIQDQTRCAPTACPPGADDPDGCVEPMVSVGQIESADYPGRVFAQWLMVDLPAGLTEGSFLAHDVDDVQLVHEATTGWKVYVQSTGAGSASVNPDSGATIATNQWVPIDQFQDMAFSVPLGADITVYLCNPTATPFEGCADVDSSAETYRSTSDGGSTFLTTPCQGIIWSSVTGLTCVDTVHSGGTPGYTEGFDTPCGIVQDIANGWTVELLSGTAPITVVWIDSTGGRSNTNLNFVGDVVNVTGDVNSLLVANGLASDPAGHPFSIRICQPEE